MKKTEKEAPGGAEDLDDAPDCVQRARCQVLEGVVSLDETTGYQAQDAGPKEEGSPGESKGAPGEHVGSEVGEVSQDEDCQGLQLSHALGQPGRQESAVSTRLVPGQQGGQQAKHQAYQETTSDNGEEGSYAKNNLRIKRMDMGQSPT